MSMLFESLLVISAAWAFELYGQGYSSKDVYKVFLGCVPEALDSDVFPLPKADNSQISREYCVCKVHARNFLATKAHIGP
jgi:hypothetical protein